MSSFQVMVFGLEGLQPEEYVNVANPEGVCKVFDIDDSKPIDLQVRNRIQECENDPSHFKRFALSLWLHKDLKIAPVGNDFKQFRVCSVDMNSPEPASDETAEAQPDSSDQQVYNPTTEAAAIQEQLESFNAVMTLTYAVLAEASDMFTAMAETAKLYVMKLEEVGFSREEAVSIAKAYMSDTNRSGKNIA